MPISIAPPTMPQMATIPTYQQYICPFCQNSNSKEIRYEHFDHNTGAITVRVMDVHSYQNLVLNNQAQPHLKEIYRPLECYCPVCYTAFSISKSLGIVH